ncbi:aminoglycoside phosphotransferase family protein [Ornithinibacillus massiliensis]|uniref:Aminoglycoside phosphotransferase family protein n=1 Tax=Ornithinibacillus massiliensis TaxID=1944633 RepID=A0ABS5MIK7_9BACI|nr:aminoglycoside phosphotransferase family protein [Ornithinibacillus massiliensis]MBS3682125.1 aminoglycoside phosphotransferase family protein [Ornithinibacillus massiliensis]
MDNQLKKEIEAVVGKLNSITLLPNQGCTSSVQQITTGRNKFLLKTSYKEKYREWLKSEAEVLKKLASHTEIPVPTYYGNIEEADRSHLIMSFEAGMTLTSALKIADTTTEKKALMKGSGELLQKLHETKPIDLFNHRGDWLDNQLVMADRYLEMGEADGNAALLNKLKSTKPIPVNQTIIHGDCTADNVLVVDGKVQMFIDVAGMTIGDPRYDESLAISRFIDNEVLIKSFYEGYTRYKVSKEEYSYFDEGLYEFF